MVSDSDIARRLREILGESDLDTATPSSVRRRLEEEFGVDLSDRKSFIREQIDLYLNTHMFKAEESENAAAEGDGAAAEEPPEEEEEEAEEEEERSDGKRKGKRGPSKVDEVVKKKRGGFTKLCSLSPQLQKLVGESELARTEVVKKLWVYIRENNLQDPSNRKTILCDESLQALFRVKSIDMFKMNKSLSKHIWPLSSEGESVKKEINTEESSHSMSEADVSEEEEEEKKEKKKEEKKRKGRRKGGSTKGEKETKKRGGGGFTKLCGLSPELQKFTGCSELARTEVVKRIWAYIKEKDLQDPENKRNILCDEALHELFHVDSIDMFKMNKALSEHIRMLKAGDAPDDSSQKDKVPKQEEEASDEEPERKGKRHKDEGSVKQEDNDSQ